MRKEFCRWVMWVRMVRACGNGVRSSEGLEKGGEGLKSITDSRGLVDQVNTAVPRLLLSRSPPLSSRFPQEQESTLSTHILWLLQRQP